MRILYADEIDQQRHGDDGAARADEAEDEADGDAGGEGEGEGGQEEENAGEENVEVLDRRHINKRYSSALLRQKRRARVSQQRKLKKRKWLSRT